MRILVANNTLDVIGGSETYAYALVSELVKKGHDVEAMSASTIGNVGNRLKNKGILVTTSPRKREYDLVLASHTSSVAKIQRLKGFKIQTCHGVGHHLEQPARGVDCYVAISEEVQKYLQRKGLQAEIIHNGVDVKRFKENKPLNPTIKSVLSLSQSVPLNETLRILFRDRGIKFTSFNKFINPVFDVEKYINEADLVISLGRGAYEAMACGRVVYCMDNRNYISLGNMGDGILTPDNIHISLTANCSGRATKRIFEKDDILAEMKKYDLSIGSFSRKFAVDKLNISKQAIKYLNLVR